MPEATSPARGGGPFCRGAGGGLDRYLDVGVSGHHETGRLRIGRPVVGAPFDHLDASGDALKVARPVRRVKDVVAYPRYRVRPFRQVRDQVVSLHDAYVDGGHGPSPVVSASA